MTVKDAKVTICGMLISYLKAIFVWLFSPSQKGLSLLVTIKLDKSHDFCTA